MPTIPSPSADGAPPERLSVALKEWAVAIRALREGRQVMLLRKGGILDAGGEFSVEAREVLLFPTYLHEDEQIGSLQNCYGQWLREENQRRATGEEVVRIDAWARITDVLPVTNPDALYRLMSQHIYSERFLRSRIENEPHKQLYALFLRAYELPAPYLLTLEPDHYGCRSWITISSPVELGDSPRPVLSDHTYSERVRVTRRLLTEPFSPGTSEPTPDV
jgi:hypothetical protein